MSGRKSPVKIAGFPVLGYTPETRIAAGIYTHVLYTGSPTNHYSGLGFFAGISQNKQYSFNLQPDIWWNNNRFHLQGELKWQLWPDKFHGLGNGTSPDVKEDYTSRIQGIKLDLYRHFRSVFYGGFLYELEHNHITEYDTVSYAELPGGSISGSKKSMISGPGISLVMDTRDHIYYPMNGSYHQIRIVYFNKLMGSDVNYLKWIIDARKYMHLGRDHLLYVQLYGKFLFGDQIPFRNLSLFGGDKLMRGYYRGSYRDHHIIAAQVEYHSPFIWRLSGVVFAGAGDVYGPNSKNSFASIKPSAGIGLRFRFFKHEKLNLRLDYGFGRVDQGVYVHIREAF